MVEAVLLCLEHPAAVGESFNIGNARSAVTIFDLAERIKRLVERHRRDRLPAARLRRRRAADPERGQGARAARLGAEGRARRGPRAHDRVVQRAQAGDVALIRLARPDVGAEELAAVAEVARDGPADDGPEGRPSSRTSSRAPARPSTRSPSRRGRPRCTWPCSRSGSGPGDEVHRPRLHLPGDGQRRRARRREARARRRRPGDDEHRSPSGARRGHAAHEGRARPSTCSAGRCEVEELPEVTLLEDAAGALGARRRGRAVRIARPARAASRSTRARSSRPARAAP